MTNLFRRQDLDKIPGDKYVIFDGKKHLVVGYTEHTIVIRTDGRNRVIHYYNSKLVE